MYNQYALLVSPWCDSGALTHAPLAGFDMYKNNEQPTIRVIQSRNSRQNIQLDFTELGCDAQCPSGTKFEPCLRCSSCQTMRAATRQGGDNATATPGMEGYFDCSVDHCVPGCRCPDGLVLADTAGSECVRLEQCSCTDQFHKERDREIARTFNSFSVFFRPWFAIFREDLRAGRDCI